MITAEFLKHMDLEVVSKGKDVLYIVVGKHGPSSVYKTEHYVEHHTRHILQYECLRLTLHQTNWQHCPAGINNVSIIDVT